MVAYIVKVVDLATLHRDLGYLSRINHYCIAIFLVPLDDHTGWWTCIKGNASNFFVVGIYDRLAYIFV